MLWISIRHSSDQRRSLWQLLGLFLLLLGLSACGSKRSMEGARTDDEVLGNVHEGVTQLKGEEESVSFEEPGQRQKRVSNIKGGSTRSGRGKLNKVSVRKNDTLWKIAARRDVYGSGWLYPILYKANRDKIADPNALTPGQVLTVPRDLPDAEVEIAKEEAMTGQFLDTSPLPGSQPSPVPTPTRQAKPASGSSTWLWLLALLALAGGAWAYLKRRRAATPAE